MSTIDEFDIREAADGYYECALWASNDDDGVPLDDARYVDKVSPGLRGELREQVREFIRANPDLCAAATERDGYSWGRLGHDLWLSQSGCGAGFFDRCELDALWDERTIGDALEEAAGRGRVELYIGDDGLIYC